MTSNDIADALAARNKISKADARAMVAAVLDAVTEGVAKSEVTLAGFGKFTVSHRPARTGRNPRNGETIVIGPTRRIVFRPAKKFKDRVAG